MPLVTRILIPEGFTSAVIAGYALDWLRDNPDALAVPEHVRMTDAIQFALDSLKTEGVIN